nr:hypothetical protein [uncultured Desulfobacter sp.]
MPANSRVRFNSELSATIVSGYHSPFFSGTGEGRFEKVHVAIPGLTDDIIRVLHDQ